MASKKVPSYYILPGIPPVFHHSLPPSPYGLGYPGSLHQDA